ncbi:MAG TPA: hypothetical protein VF103_09160 [Polyangiaceae bacterium]
MTHAEVGRVPPPRQEVDAGPPPLPRAPEHARRQVELVSSLDASLPTCQSGVDAERCTALSPAIGAGLSALYRENPYFAFGAGVGYSRSSGARLGGVLDGEAFTIGALGRVYLYEEGAFDPYLELELGYGSLRTTLVSGGARYEHAAFGPAARVGGGMDFSVLPILELGMAVGFSHLLLERGETCAARGCAAGSAPSGAMVGSLMLGLRATVLLGKAL